MAALKGTLLRRDHRVVLWERSRVRRQKEKFHGIAWQLRLQRTLHLRAGRAVIVSLGRGHQSQAQPRGKHGGRGKGLWPSWASAAVFLTNF